MYCVLGVACVLCTRCSVCTGFNVLCVVCVLFPFVHSHSNSRLKLPPSSHLEISCGADIILPQEDHKHIALLAQRDRVVSAVYQ